MDGGRRKSELSAGADTLRWLDRGVWAAAILWTVAVTVALWMPPPPVIIPNLWLDKATHFVMFAGVGGLWCWAIPRAWTVFFAAAFVGMFTEVGQGWWPWGRTPDVIDFVFDALGAGAGVAVAVKLPPPWR